jgi:hypothetical protein
LSPVSLKVAPAGDKAIAFTLSIHIGIIDLTLVQIAGKEAPTKRLFRLTVDKFPLISKIPLIKELPQPFEKLVYMYVLDSQNLGWTSEDIDIVNHQFDQDTNSYILCQSTTQKANSSPAQNSDPPKAVIVPGHHFLVVEGGKIILDHVFGKPKDQPKEQTVMASKPNTNATNSTTTTNKNKIASEIAPTKGALSKKQNISPLAMLACSTRMGLSWSHSTRRLLLDR